MFRSLDDDAFGKPSGELNHFTNREDELATFQRILQIPTGEPIPLLMFYGVGGAGKSWLLKRLRQDAEQLPSAYIDLDPRFGRQSFPADPSRVLGDIRRQLGNSVRCPRFDLAYTWLQFKEGRQDEPNFLGSGVLGEAWEFVVEAGSLAASGISGASLVAWLVKRATSPVKKWLQESGVGDWLATKFGQEDFVRLRRLLPGEIYPELHDRLLKDLREHLPARQGQECRGVIFIDTVDSVQGHRDSAERLFEAQGWLRELYHPESGLLIVLAGRDRLTWGRDESSPFAKLTVLEQHLVGGLSELDARDFLVRCGVTDSTLKQAILKVSEDTESPRDESSTLGYHALSLGLCADTCWILNQRGEMADPSTFEMTTNDTRSLAARFLRSFGGDGAYAEWLKRLALTIRFDKAAARASFSSDASAEQDFAWRSLAGYSFIRQAEEPGWLMLHARMRDALDMIEQTDDAAHWREGHRWWQQHWRGRAENKTDRFAGTAWYHAWHLDASAARQEWNDLATAARQDRRMADHYALLAWWEPCLLADRLEDAKHRMEAVSALNDWGIEYWHASQGNRDVNLRNAIGCFEVALRVFTEADFPQNWATLQNNLGNAYSDLPSGDRDANLRNAIACFEAALRVHTDVDFPYEWAMTQNNLGVAYRNLPLGDRAANLRNAIACFEAALRVRTDVNFPQAWATTQNNLGNAYGSLPLGDRAANLQHAIACFEAALRVFTEVNFPQDWAMTQNNLGNALRNLPSGDRDANVQNSIACFEAALRVYSEADSSQDWARTQNNLGTAFCNVPSGDRDANLQHAIAYFKAALRVRTEVDFPQAWAMTQNNLGNAYRNLPSGDRDANLRSAIACYEAALRVLTEVDFPQDWATTQNNLGNAYCTRPSGDRDANLRDAIACYDAALRVLTEVDFPNEHADVLDNLRRAKDMLGLDS